MADVQPTEAETVETLVAESAAPENGDSQQPAEEQAGAAATDATPAVEEPAKEDTKKHPTGRTVIVRNIPPAMLFTYQEDLKTRFAKYGDIGYVKLGGITVDHSTVQPTLTAFVNFADPESSDKAMEENGADMGGNALELQVLRSGEFTAVMNNIPAIISEESLHLLFSPCGEIKKIVKIPARPTAFVEFADEESLNKALSLNGSLSMNNVEINITKQGTEVKGRTESKNKMRKSKLAKARTAAAVRGGPAPIIPRGGGVVPRGGPISRGGPIPRGGVGSLPRGRGGVGRGGAGSGWASTPNWGGNQYNQWGDGGGDYGRNYGNWGNGNYSSNNDGQRGFKRRKQNDWIWQY